MMTEGFWLSQQQRRSWLFSKQHPIPYGYISLEIKGGLVMSRLGKAMAKLVGYHEILRTVFEIPDAINQPLQVVRAEVVVPELGTTLVPQRLVWDGVQTSSNLKVDVAKQDGGFRLTLQIHPLCCDWISLQLVSQELFEIYACLSEGNEWEDDPVQYAQYTEWRQSLHEGGAQDGFKYWLGQPMSTPQNLPFFTALSAADPQNTGTGYGRVDLARLPAILANDPLELESICLTAWQWCLAQYLAEEQVDLAVFTDGRTYEELELGQGCYANFLPFPPSIEPNQSFSAASDHVRLALADMRQFRDFFDLEAHPVRSCSFGFACHWLMPATTIGSLEIRILDIVKEQEPFQLALSCLSHADRQTATLFFDKQIFTQKDADAIAQSWLTLLAAITAQPQLTRRQVPLRPATRLLVSGNRLSPQEPSSSFFDLVANVSQTAQSHPERSVLVDEDAAGQIQEISYAQLVGLVDRLAASLLRRGIGPGDRVAIHLPRSSQFVVAILAVLKVGAAYVPLDPEIPSQRLAKMVALTSPQLCVSQAEDASKFGISNLAFQAAQATDRICRDPWIDDRHLAYIIFTSGSTGEPKGVMVSRQNLQAYISGMGARLDLDQGERFAVATTFAADLGHTALFLALATAGTLHILSRDTVTLPDRFATYFKSQAIDVIKMTPSHLGALMGDVPDACVLPRKALVLGGEAISAQLLAKIRKIRSDLAVWNHYGPTEATVGVAAHQLAGVVARLPIGKPLDHVCLYTLGQTGHLCPPHVKGQLAIGGLSLAQGYWRRPAWTADRFRPDPFSPQPGARIYLSGDVAYRNRDDDFVFLGRDDDQVKLSGYRVELGEIEKALLQNPGIAQALVMLQPPANLVGFVVCPAATHSEAALVKKLHTSLPAYMVPARILCLPSFPLTPNQKVDRQKLVALLAQTNRDTCVAARTETERKLVIIWSDVLHTRINDVRASFFDLGGHSLLSIQMIHRVHDVFPKRLTLTHVLRYPTIETLAGYLEEDQDQVQMPVLLGDETASKCLFLLHPSGGDVHWYLPLAQKLNGHRKCYGLEAPAQQTQPGSFSDIQELAAYQAQVIQRIQPRGPYTLAGWSAGGTLALAVGEHLESQGSRVDEVILIDAFHHRDETRVKIFQFALLDFLSETLRQSKQDYLGLAENLHSCGMASQSPSELIRSLVADGVLPAETDVSALAATFNIYLNNRTAINDYNPKNLYLGKLRLIRARYTLHDASGFREDFNYDESHGWRKLGYSNLAIRNIRGDHYTIMQGKYVADLADVLTGKAGRFRAGSGPIKLLVTLKDNPVARILTGVIGVFETMFPEKIDGYYLMGSHAGGVALQESDLDMLVVLKRKLSFQDMEQAKELSAHCHLLYNHGIDFRFNTKSELERIGITAEIEEMVHLYGSEFQPPAKDMRFHTNMRFRLHTSLLFFREVRYPLTVLHYPLTPPQKDNAYLGYTCETMVLGSGKEVASTRSLINILTKPSMGWLAWRGGVHLVNKRDVAPLMGQHIDRDLGDLLTEAMALCRDRWHYQVPEDLEGQAQLRDLCERALAFENQYLLNYREFLVQELHDDTSPIPWLTIDEMIQYLAIPQYLLDAALVAGTLETKEENDERLIYHPRLYRLLAINAMARLIFDDNQAQQALLPLMDEAIPCQRYLIETALSKIERYQTIPTAGG